MLLSFDIGIKNLAYCKLDKTGKIITWNVVDILEEPEKCKLCKRKVKVTDNRDFYCNFHGKGLAVYKPKPIKNYKPEELVEKAITKLDSLKDDFNGAESVVLELQMRINPKMKLLSDAIFTWFIIMKKNYPGMKSVSFIAAKNKLNLYNGPPIQCKLKSQYTRSKFLGKKHCEYFLSKNGNEYSKNVYSKSKKKDDLADCYLQGLFCLSKHSKDFLKLILAS